MIDLLAASGLQQFATDIPLLTAIVLAPLVGALVIALMPRDNGSIRQVAIVSTAVTFALTVLLLLAFAKGNGDFQFVSEHEWLKAFGIEWKLGVDGISLFLVVLTGLIFPIAFIAAGVSNNVKSFSIWMLVLQSGCLGSFLALDLFLFFVCFEAVLVPMYFLMIGWGYARKRYAALKFFLYTLTGSATLFVGMLALVVIDAAKTGRGWTFDFVTLAANQSFTDTEARWLFFAFAIAFAVKIPLVPLHTWIGDTYENAPVAGVVISAAVMVKLGTYGLLRFAVSMFPDAAYDIAPVLLTLAVIGMIYGAVIAAVQHDLKRVAAYSSVSHLGFIVLGTFAFSSEGMTGAVLQMINHGITAAAFFLLLGFLYARTSSTDVRQLRGVQKVAPIFAAVMTVVVMSSIGVPGLNGFVGEFLILLGTFVTHRWWAVVGCAAVVLSAVYLLWAYQQVFHGEPNDTTNKLIDLTGREKLAMAPLIALIVFLGVYPQPVLDRIEPSVEKVLVTTPEYNGGHTPALSPVVVTDDANQGADNGGH
jgi:NADH-quinone oxidoreductase subunit M